MIDDPSLREIAENSLVRLGVTPGASLALAHRRAGAWEVRVGGAGHLDRGRRRPVSAETPFDLASVTKSVFALTVARLAHSGAIDLGDPLARYLAEARGTPSAELPLELFLAHRAGLAAHRTLFAPLVAGQPIRRTLALQAACNARRADARGPVPEHGFAPVYSDLGYLLAGVAVERAVGQPLDEVVREEVTGPLGLGFVSARQAVRAEGFSSRVAATEVVAWRGGVVCGIVHDENAWALGGHGLCGHAGLFGTAESVARFGCAVLDVLSGRAPELLPPEAAEWLVRPRPGSTLRAGFDGVEGPGSAAGTQMSRRTFGHLGFTGTSLWCDPDAGVVAVILTNRVHPTRDHLAIRKARPRVQDALISLLCPRP